MTALLRPEYRALADAASEAGFAVEAAVPLRGVAPLPLVVEVPPFRFAPIVAAYPPGRWLSRGADESLTDYAARAWPVLTPIQHAAARAGIVALVFPPDECRDRPAAVIAWLVAIRDALLCFAQGMPEADAVARFADALGATGGVG